MLRPTAGLIPAHAGKTGRCAAGEYARWAHPRSRGENIDDLLASTGFEGSSPLTRGKRAGGCQRRGRERLIPAHAGKTRVRIRRSGQVGAHPRSRGENPATVVNTVETMGSSPLTRGKRLCRCRPLNARGLIPAHAGKTSMRSMSRWLDRAHPRSRGENQGCAHEGEQAAGSSPLTRGKRVQLGELRAGIGLIPAHAGKTLPDLRFYRADRSDLGKP